MTSPIWRGFRQGSARTSGRLEDLQRSFARNLRAEGRSERTATIYGQAIRFYGDWLLAQGRPATMDELNRAAIRE